MSVEARFVVRYREDQSVHGRLKLKRGDRWHVVGVFDFNGEEWAELAQFCDRQGIEIRDAAEERNGL
jgi:hypothetical protein